ncbi:tetratricopeptide repeat-containing diguanylate cyclase [Colwellia psychrerythraea]|uniref:diguanylate cyclase n=1 Tax=Colwellia psychrerythraea (strain 34H / ATCC BAA-681) TaxID=167879 RepID=Q489G0_COLP3|nr:GGDEF domain-containing protein [Colwellia psychrerythraea]AAZ26927.1 GGDEF domain protein [Colwellia psychrerythraea 34H]
MNKNILTFFIIISFFTTANASADFDAKLSLADSIRSSKPQEFSVIIKGLNQEKSKLSTAQYQHLKYLNTYSLMFQGKLDEAIYLAKEIIISDANETLKFRAKISLMNIFANRQNWTEGLTNLSSLLKDLPSVKNEDFHQLALVAASMFYNQLGQYQLALSYAKKIEARAGQNRNQCLAKGFIVEALSKSHQLSTNDPIIEQAIEVCRKNNEILMVSFINSHIVRTYIYNEQFIKAIELLNATLQSTVNINFSRITAEYYSLLANAYWQTNELAKAQYFALKTLESKNQLSSRKAKILANHLLYKIYKHQNNLELALSYFEVYSELGKEHLKGEKAKHFAFQLAEHQNIEQESKIKLLNEKNSLLLSDQALSKAKVVNIQLMISILMVTLALLVLWGARLLKAHKRVRELAEYDPLTGIYNRGHFTHVTNSALKYCKNAQQDLSVIMFDLDHFKKVNDSFGHACGDWALKETIKVCQRIGRKNDIFARLGGEEFCLVLTCCTIDVAMLRAEACRAAIEEIITEESGNDFSITASFGVTDIKRSGFTLDKLLADADMAAYASKNAGRNRVTLFEVPYTAKANKLDDSWNYN